MRARLLLALASLSACASTVAPSRGTRAIATAPTAQDNDLHGHAPDTTGEHIYRIEHGLLLGARLPGAATYTVEERMRAHHIHGMSVAVIDDFKVAWAKGYGTADVETRAQVSATTLFQAGSISKPVATMAALKLVEEGKLSLDAKINDALKTWKLPDNELTRASPVTLKMLLSHTAGITVHGFPGYAAGEPVPTLPQIFDGIAPANTAPIRVDLAPGKEFRYSGGGMTLMQQAVIDVTGEPFPALVAEKVLTPIGMDHSTYEQPLPAGRVESAAAGYDGEGIPIVGKRHVYPEMAAAGLWTTPTDLARFAIELALESTGKSSRVLSTDMARRMLTKVASAGESDDVGLGIFLERHGGVTYFGHDGADEGFQAVLIANADKGCGAALMASSDDGIPVMKEMIRAIAAEYGWPGYDDAVALQKLAPERLAELAGHYQVNGDRVLRLTVLDGSLVVSTPFLESAEIVPISDSVFVRRNEQKRYTFTKAKDGSIEVRIDPSLGWPVAKRVPDAFTVALDDLAAGRFDEALARYRAGMAKSPNDDAFAEDRFNSIGGQALSHGHPADAIMLFRLNVALYPDSMNTYDSLAEAYVAADDRAHAIATFRDALAAEVRDKKTPAIVKDKLHKNAVDKLARLAASSPPSR